MSLCDGAIARRRSGAEMEPMTEPTRALLVRIRGLLLLAVDLIDRECKLGRYSEPRPVKVQDGDTITGVQRYD